MQKLEKAQSRQRRWRITVLDHKELILFIKQGGLCEEFGHTLEKKEYYPEDNAAKFKCKFCKHEEWQ